jgi:hypothetical protein
MESLRLGEGGVLVVGEVNGGELPGGEVVEGLQAAVVEEEDLGLLVLLQKFLGFLVDFANFNIAQI